MSWKGFARIYYLQNDYDSSPYLRNGASWTSKPLTIHTNNPDLLSDDTTSYYVVVIYYLAASTSGKIEVYDANGVLLDSKTVVNTNSTYAGVGSYHLQVSYSNLPITVVVYQVSGDLVTASASVLVSNTILFRSRSLYANYTYVSQSAGSNSTRISKQNIVVKTESDLWGITTNSIEATTPRYFQIQASIAGDGFTAGTYYTRIYLLLLMWEV